MTAAAQHDAPSLRTGERVGDRYVVEGWLGSGGMAEVYRALDEASGRAVALKVLRRSVAGDAEAAERLRREGRVLAALRHPAIVAFEAAGTLPDGRLFLAMELLEGRTLRARIEDGQMLPGEVSAVLEPLVEGLQVAHGRGILHRDLKPDNVFLCDGSGGVKVLDFGISKVLGLERLTRTGQVLGTPRYMAPEQLRGEGDFDARVDVYALGVVLYEALSGCSPFRAETPGQLIPAILAGRVVPLRERCPEISSAVAEVIQHAMAVEPERRFGSVQALLAAWRAALSAPSRPSRAALDEGSPSQPGQEAPTAQLRPSRPSASGARPREVGRAPAQDGATAGQGTAPVGAARPGSGSQGGLPSAPPSRPAQGAGGPDPVSPRYSTEPVELPVRGPGGGLPRWAWLVLGAAACLVAGAVTAWVLVGSWAGAERDAASVTPERAGAPAERTAPRAGHAEEARELPGAPEEPPVGEPPPVPEPDPSGDEAAGAQRGGSGRHRTGGRAHGARRRASRPATRGAAPAAGVLRAAGGAPPRKPVATVASAPVAEGDKAAVGSGDPAARARAARRAGRWRACVEAATEAMARRASSSLLKLRGDCLRQLGDRGGALRDYHRFCRVAFDHPAIAEVRAAAAALGSPCP